MHRDSYGMAPAQSPGAGCREALPATLSDLLWGVRGTTALSGASGSVLCLMMLELLTWFVLCNERKEAENEPRRASAWASRAGAGQEPHTWDSPPGATPQDLGDIPMGGGSPDPALLPAAWHGQVSHVLYSSRKALGAFTTSPATGVAHSQLQPSTDRAHIPAPAPRGCPLPSLLPGR